MPVVEKVEVEIEKKEIVKENDAGTTPVVPIQITNEAYSFCNNKQSSLNYKNGKNPIISR